MKILIVANGYPDQREPQWGCFERDQALALSKYGHEVSIIYFDRRFRKYWRKIGITKRQEQGLFIYGLYVMPLGWLRDMVSFRLHHKVVRYGLDILYREYIKDNGKPDVIYAHYIWNISYATILKKKYGIPLVGMEHWSGLNNDSLLSKTMYMGELAYNNTDKLISVAATLRERIKSHFNKDSVVIHNMVGAEFLHIPICHEKRDERLSFISVGSLLPVKGYDILINAMSLATKELPSWSLIIIGEGPEHERLEQLIESKGLSEQISLLGRKTKSEIIQNLNNSSVYISSSRSENFSVAVLEALAAGLPVVATLCGDIKECVNNNNGLLVPVEDIQGLSQAIVAISSNISKYDNIKIAEDCRRCFAPQVIAQQLTDIFDDIINSKI